MSPKKSIKRAEEANKGFTLRGLENTRIESLSDGVFAIAIGLLLISTTAPTTYDELLTFIREFVPFAITISLLMFIWHQHYLFFIRYGLRDSRTVTLNTLLLFLILFYVYPLKFLFSVLITVYRGIFTGNGEVIRELFETKISPNETGELMIIYGLGATAIFGVLALLNYTAYRRRDVLQLSPIERVHTSNAIRNNVLCGAIPLLSSFIALINLGGENSFAIAGMTYMLYGVIMPLAGRRGKKKLARVTTG